MSDVKFHISRSGPEVQPEAKDLGCGDTGTNFSPVHL